MPPFFCTDDNRQRALQTRPSNAPYELCARGKDIRRSCFCRFTGNTAAEHTRSTCGKSKIWQKCVWFAPHPSPHGSVDGETRFCSFGRSRGKAELRSGTPSPDCLRWESPVFRQRRMSDVHALSAGEAPKKNALSRDCAGRCGGRGRRPASSTWDGTVSGIKAVRKPYWRKRRRRRIFPELPCAIRR